MSHDLGILDITQNSSHKKDQKYLMECNGWVMWNMGTFNDPCFMFMNPYEGCFKMGLPSNHPAIGLGFSMK